jgi:hypothetical protein
MLANAGGYATPSRDGRMTPFQPTHTKTCYL